MRIGVLSFFGRATQGEALLRRLVILLSSVVPDLHVVAPDLAPEDIHKISIHTVHYQLGTNVVSQFWHQFKAQLQMSAAVVKASGKVDAWLFYGGDVLILPMMVTKLIRKPAWLLLAGNLESEIKLKKSPLNGLQMASRRGCLGMADRIILYSSLLIEKWSLRRYEHKIAVVDTHYVDTAAFAMVKPLHEREFDVGFIGRLSFEKGIMNFLCSLPFIMQKGDNLKVLIVGGGPLEGEVTNWIHTNRLGDKVFFRGKANHLSIPGILNEIKICVLPSYTEGMPNIALESMACGTPVVATPVGAIPDIVLHQDTGFIIQDNSPESIAQGIIDALASPDLGCISLKARAQIQGRFTFERARARLLEFLGLI